MSILVLPTDVIAFQVLKPYLTLGEILSFCSSCSSFIKIWDMVHQLDAKRWFSTDVQQRLSKAAFLKLYALEHDITKHKPLPLVAVSSDAPQYDDHYGLSNLVFSHTCCYCTKNVPENVNVILTLGPVEGCKSNPEDLVMFITQFDIRAPSSGYTSPLDTSIVYVTDEMPDISRTKCHDSLTQEMFQKHYAHKSHVELKANMEPIFFNSCVDNQKNKLQTSENPTKAENGESNENMESDDNVINEAEAEAETYRQDVKKPYPVGRWILFKMISASGEKTNIDAGYFGARGFIFDLNTMEHVTYPDLPVYDGPIRTCSVM